MSLNVISHGRPWTYPGVNHLYTDDRFDRAIMVVENIVGRRETPVIIFGPQLIIYEYPLSKESYSSIAFYNIPKNLINDLLPTKKSVFNILRILSISSANAATENCVGVNPGASVIDSLSPLSTLYSTEYFSLGSSCFLGVLSGIWDSTGGMVVSAVEGLKKLISNPQEFWNEKVEAFKKLKSFLFDFETSIKRLWSNFELLSDEQKAEILCSFVGSIGTDILIAALTAGTGTSKIALSVKAFIEKFAKIESILVTLGKLNRIAEIPKGFLNKIAKGKILEKTLNSIQGLATHGMEDYALQLMECSI